MTYRFTTDCLTGLRHWRWFVRVGRPVRNLIGPCSKAAIVIPPLLAFPSNFAPFSGGWGMPGYENTGAGAEASPLTPAGSFLSPFSRGEGLLAVPGTINPVNVSPHENITYSMPPVIPGTPVESVDVSQSTDVPEPSSIVLVGVGAGAAILVRRRRG